jgi:hypothetical protein
VRCAHYACAAWRAALYVLRRAAIALCSLAGHTPALLSRGTAHNKLMFVCVVVRRVSVSFAQPILCVC